MTRILPRRGHTAVERTAHVYTWRDVQYSLLARYTVHLDLAIAFDESDVIRVSRNPALVHVILKAKRPLARTEAA